MEPAQRLPSRYEFVQDANNSTTARRLLAELLTQPLTLSQYLACLEAFRLLTGNKVDGITLRLALTRLTAVPTYEEACRACDVLWWFFDCRTSWLRVTERELMRDIHEDDARRVHRVWGPRIRTIAQALGVPFSQFRAAMLLRLALLRLAHTDDRVRQIAYDLDYSHASALNHHVKGVVGMSPRAFRTLIWGRANERVEVGNVLPYTPKPRATDPSPER